MIKKRGQVSFEYITIMGFGILVLLIAIYSFYNYSLNSNDSFVVSKIDDLGNKLVDSSEVLYYTTGESSSITLETVMPDEVKEIYFVNRSQESEIVIGYNLRRGYSESVYFIPLRVRGKYDLGSDKTSIFNSSTFHTGALRLRITNVKGGVYVEETT